MNQYNSQQFIHFALAQNVLRFGEFELKSGRVSPYFFNAGLFASGASLQQLGRFYAAAILRAEREQGLQFDMLFGPAYKGIGLCASTAIALAEQGRDIGYAFNRKEAKTHGEGGNIVGAALEGRVLIVDDVITAGTAIGESMQILAAHGATLAGVLIALNRQERGSGALSATSEVEQRYQTQVYSIANFADLIRYVSADPQFASVEKAMLAYRHKFGVEL